MEKDELKSIIISFIKDRIANTDTSGFSEEKTKMSLIIPFFEKVLGYNDREFEPEFAADQNPKNTQKVDYAILIDKKPRILIEAKQPGIFGEKHKNLEVCRGQLASYFSQLAEAQVGILTDGIEYFLYDVDNHKKMMRKKAFSYFNLKALSEENDIPDHILDTILSIRRGSYSSDDIERYAKKSLIRSEIKKYLKENFEKPSDDFLHFLLTQIKEIVGQNITNNIKDSYRTQIANACKDFSNDKISEVFNEIKKANTLQEESYDMYDSGIVTEEEELRVFTQIKTVLPFLLTDENHIAAVEDIYYKDYKNFFKIYYRNIEKGRMIHYNMNSSSYEFPLLKETIKNISLQDIYKIQDKILESFKKAYEVVNGK